MLKEKMASGLLLGLILLAASAVRAQERPGVRYVDAATLTLIGGAMPAPCPFQRVDTTRYELWEPVKSYSAFPTGMAVVFRTDARTIRARWTTAGYAMGHNMTAIARKGLDLYIERDGEWVYAGFGKPNMSRNEHESVLVAHMAPGEKRCLLYLPLWDGVRSLEVGVEQGASILPAPNPFRHRVVVLGSSITHGAAAGRPGMTYVARLARATGIDFINLGFSGQCKLQPEFARMLAEMDADAFVFDAFSNPLAAEIDERLAPFVAAIRAAHPSTPLVFLQTVVRETGNFSERARSVEAAKRAAGERGVRRLMKHDKHLYFIDSQGMLGDNHLGTVDGTHPSDEGFMHMVEHIERPLRKILRRYDIR